MITLPYNETFPRNPLYVLRGVWLEEQETASDLYNLTDLFDQEIREVVSGVHGDNIIDTYPGKHTEITLICLSKM